MACSAKHHDPCEVWRVAAVSSGEFPVKTGMTMVLLEDSVTFNGKDQSFSYPVLKSKDRLVMGTGANRMLFRLEEMGDSVLLLQELYALHPLTISFSAETNPKK